VVTLLIAALPGAESIGVWLIVTLIVLQAHDGSAVEASREIPRRRPTAFLVGPDMDRFAISAPACVA